MPSRRACGAGNALEVHARRWSGRPLSQVKRGSCTLRPWTRQNGWPAGSSKTRYPVSGGDDLLERQLPHVSVAADHHPVRFVFQDLHPEDRCVERCKCPRGWAVEYRLFQLSDHGAILRRPGCHLPGRSESVPKMPLNCIRSACEAVWLTRPVDRIGETPRRRVILSQDCAVRHLERVVQLPNAVFVTEEALASLVGLAAAWGWVMRTFSTRRAL